MKIKTFILALTLLSTVLIAGCLHQPIGGQRGEHGCLGPAGYTWSADANACIRTWELNENQVKAAKIAVDHIGYEKGITIIQVLVARCPGCFSVELEKGVEKRDRIKVQLENWKVKEQSLTPDECLAKGGRTVNTVGGDTCSDDELNFGDVTGFISPNICCMKIAVLEESKSAIVLTGLCSSDNECIPLPSECHPQTCINKEHAGNYEKPDTCTEIAMSGAAYKPDDCICVNSRCTNKNRIDNTGQDSSSLTMDEVLEIMKDSECAQGEIGETTGYNINTKTWWIDLEIEKEGCNPACVISEETKTAVINWRCTGLISPE